MGGWERVEGEDVVFGVVEHRGDLRELALKLADGLSEPGAGLGEVWGGEQRPDQGAEGVVLGLGDVPAQVAQKVDGAALPGGPKNLRERGLQAWMGVGDGELDADQAARDQAPEEGAPERLGLGRADVQADDLAAAGLVDGVRDNTPFLTTRPPSRTFSTFASTNR